MRRLSKIIGTFLLLALTVVSFADCCNGCDECYPFWNNQISLGFYSRNFYTVDLPKPPSPFFWDATAKANWGMIGEYQHLVFNTRKYFSVYAGFSVAGWQSYQARSESLYTVSALLSMKFWFFHTTFLSPYLVYSIAAPTIISQTRFGTANLGKNFLFQDILGLGLALGRCQNITVEAAMVHYSNGDIFTHNSGFDVPIVFSIGYMF